MPLKLNKKIKCKTMFIQFFVGFIKSIFLNGKEPVIIGTETAIKNQKNMLSIMEFH